jgi:hypothetical protein
MRGLTRFLVLAASVGCAPTLPQVTEGDARAAGVPVAELRADRQTYVDKCSGCHRPFPPGKLEAARWPRVIDEMQAREEVVLSAAQRAAIERYLRLFARTAPR